MEKLSHEEHRARAMLMGRVYDWRDGTYCLVNELDHNHLLPRGMMDCDMLEVIEGYPIERMLHLTNNVHWYDEPTVDGPWVRKDET